MWGYRAKTLSLSRIPALSGDIGHQVVGDPFGSSPMSRFMRADGVEVAKQHDGRAGSAAAASVRNCTMNTLSAPLGIGAADPRALFPGWALVRVAVHVAEELNTNVLAHTPA